ncbi:hypothetical protein HUJ05_000937 [Dendroctonus ponderosae]|nr:hypothetical protein HUJ05_000937 [Dendroctonus ponderosae]
MLFNFRYLESEFPRTTSNNSVFHIPKEYLRTGENQGRQAEQIAFQRLKNLSTLNVSDLWILFFHSISYGGYSNRNQRLGKLIMREHDFVVFVKYQGRNFVLFVEVKSTNDRATIKHGIEMVADSKTIKNHKRTAQHQLRDHLEILKTDLDYEVKDEIQCYIMWPFLGENTTDPKQQIVKRWTEDDNLHVFENTIASQEAFNSWFLRIVVSQKSCSDQIFAHLISRYIVLSCGIFMDEIDKDLLALLTQEQVKVLTSPICQKGGALVVHGIAGTGKTLLILKKLQLLHQNGQLNEKKRALYVCYWPGIRCEVKHKLKIMGLEDYVDTTRFYITSTYFMKNNRNKYKHIFMDETEAIIISFGPEIVQNTFYKIYQAYHDGNCFRENCSLSGLEAFQQHPISALIKLHIEAKISWGELWFMVDTNQAFISLPKNSPEILKSPHIILNKLIRSTSQICSFFSIVTQQPVPLNMLNFPKSQEEPPIFWVPRKQNVSQSVCEVIVDLCAAKGIKPSDICVIPFLQNEMLSIEAINLQICQKFVEKAFRPECISDVEDFLTDRKPYEFLLAWALRVKGLEFKVVVMVIDEDQFDYDDVDDRKRVYVICSRSTCMLIVISDDQNRREIGLSEISEEYCFNIKFGCNRDLEQT